MKAHSLNKPPQIALLSAGGALCLALLYLFARHWGDVVQYCLALQITLHRYLVLYMLQQRDHQISGGLMLIFGSFVYGFLHSVGPGHGKFVITTYLATHRQHLKISRAITLLGSLMQGVVAIVFIVVLAILFNLSTGDLSRSRYWIEKASALLIAVFGLALLFRAAGINPLSLLRRRAHSDHHAECGCGHKHQPTADELTGGWRNALWVIATIGIRPCSGALMILLFANAIGMFSWGVAAVLVMSLGTALSITILATVVHHAREWVLTANAEWATRYATALTKLTMTLGGLILILFALVLFTTVIPVSANGDFIAAGC